MKYLEIDVDHARRVLEYFPETGEIIRKVSTSARVKVGDHAGSINSKGYLTLRLNGVHVLAHRVAWVIYHGKQPIELDHINGIRNDNRIANLRECNKSEQAVNKELYKSNTSGIKGVHWVSKSNNWQARIQKSNKRINLGRFTTKRMLRGLI
jgi:hypothetical protein